MRLPCLVALVLSVAGPAGAQEQSAALFGLVKDPSASVVPGARVEARSEGGLGVTAVSDAVGRYRFASLPPGRYDLTAKVAGFAPAVAREVDLPLGQTLRVDLALSVANVAEALTVGAEAPLIDVTQSARSTHLRGEQITRLPRGRDFTSLISQAPGVNPEGYEPFANISIDGSSGSENRYVIDGVETTDVLRGNSGMGLITDVVEEVQVKSSGYAAEHGGATGGVINVVTRSGSNRWLGEVGTYYFGQWLQGSPRPQLRLNPNDPTLADTITFPKDGFDQWEPGLSLSGPLRKDAVWFFASYQPALRSTERTVTFRANGATGTFTNAVRTHNASANLTAQIKARTRLRIAFNTSPRLVDGELPFQNGNSNPGGDYDIVTHSPRHSLSGTVAYVAHPNMLLSARAAHWFADTHQDGIHQGPLYRFRRSNVGMEGVPAHLQGPQGTTNVLTNSEVTRDRVSRTTFQLDGTSFLGGAGRHALKAGLQLDRLANDVVRGETGNSVGLFWGGSFLGQRGPFGYYMLNSNSVLPERGSLVQGDVHGNNLGLFVQDAWTVTDRLTLNLGLRAERERVPSYTTEYGIEPVAIELSFLDKLAPRVGAAWDVKGDGKWKVYGSWGIFYDTMKYALPLNVFGAIKSRFYWYTLDTPDWPSLTRPGCPPACPGRLIQVLDSGRPANTPDGSAIDPELEPFQLQEAVVGVEHALARSLSVGARYVHKQIDTALDDIGALDATGNPVYIIGNPGLHRASETGFGPAFPQAVRNYDALELTVDKRMSNRWSLRGSYLLGRLYGNYSGLTDYAEGVPAPNNSHLFDHPLVSFGEDGRPVMGVLESDRTHQFKAHAVYDLPGGTSVGTSIRLLSGTPVTREATFLASEYSSPYQGRGSDGRLPALSQLDLYAQHEVKLGAQRRLQISINVLNVFDQDTPLLRSANEFLGPIDIGEAAYFRGFSTQELAAAQGIPRDPFFLKDYVFQAPREIRLGVKLTF